MSSKPTALDQPPAHTIVGNVGALLGQVQTQVDDLAAENLRLKRELAAARHALNTHNPAPPLLRLPRELRDKIFAHIIILGDEEPAIRVGDRFQRTGFAVSTSHNEKHIELFPSLMQTCQQLRDEVAQMHYSKNIFVGSSKKLESWVTLMPKHHKRLVKKVRMADSRARVEDAARETAVAIEKAVGLRAGVIMVFVFGQGPWGVTWVPAARDGRDEEEDASEWSAKGIAIMLRERDFKRARKAENVAEKFGSPGETWVLIQRTAHQRRIHSNAKLLYIPHLHISFLHPNTMHYTP
jgi:hypothetical protein